MGSSEARDSPSLAASCDLQPVGDGIYRRMLDRTWWGHNAQHGGYVEALALRAMRTELDAPEMAPVSLTFQFLRPFGDASFRAEVVVERRGRTMANLTGRLYSDEKLAGIAMAAFGVRSEQAPFVAIEPPVEMRSGPPGPEDKPMPSDLGVPTQGHFDFFPRVGTFEPGGGAARSAGWVRVGGWIRPRFDGPVDELLMVVLADVWTPAAYMHWEQPAVAASADIATQFRVTLPLPAGAASARGPFFLELRTAGSIGRFVDEDCQIWSAGGALLAQSRQLRYVHG